MTCPNSHSVEFLPRRLDGVDAISLASNRAFPRHAHDQYGIGVMTFGGHASWSKQGFVEAYPGDVIAVSPNEVHDGKPMSGLRSWKMLFVEPFVIDDMIGPNAASREIEFAAKHSPAVASAMLKIFASLCENDLTAAEEGLTGLFADLLVTSTCIGDRLPSRVTQHALQRVNDNLESPPTLEEIAVIMSMSRTGALRRFKRETGTTPHEYAMQLRLRQARRALASGNNPASVAAELGFADQSHMTRAFSRQFGVPPGKYQSSMGNIVQDPR
ncbi:MULTISPECIES: AraC family transcriptional regulator [Falsihalocynthiibacter]|uniref:AraC family transcriptional regulator n=1 Tax=Falsihalocynthiibacter TaxID=2854182 RepID=UPI0030032C98